VARPSLADRFVVPPTSTLFTTTAEWQARRRAWLALGIESELGRGLTTKTAAMQLEGLPARGGSRRAADARSNLTGAAPLPDYADFGMENVAPGTSIFDPVLCECAYRWWCPLGGTILDPFAGGSVRGIVAEYLGYRYVGIELRAEQVTSNRAQAERLGVAPDWIAGDSLDMMPRLGDQTDHVGALMPDQYDLIFTCPPYYDLEVYSDDPRDLSNLPTYADFLGAYRDIIRAAVDRLRNDRFMVMVVSDVRDKHGRLGHYYGLHSDTIRAMQDCGLRLYNDAVLINPYGTLPMRAARAMEVSRKLGRSHQNVVVMAKGQPDPRTWDLRMDWRPPSPQLSLWDEETA
jgi:hypothetical protein